MNFRILCFITLVALGGCSKSESDTSIENSVQTLNHKNEVKNSLAYKLISIDRSSNTVSIDDPELTTVNHDLAEISRLTQLPITVIGDMAWAGTSAINKNGQVVSVFDTLDMLKKVLPFQKKDLEAMDAKKVVSSNIAHYGVIRLGTNQTHEVAVSSMIDILEAMKTPEFSEAINKS